MAYKRRYNGGQNTREKVMGCSCGGKARLSSRKNYPFGKKSTGITSRFYKCSSCKNTTFAGSISVGRK